MGEEVYPHEPVSTHSRLKAAGFAVWGFCPHHFVSTHSRLKAAGRVSSAVILSPRVSTHSRLKAAGPLKGFLFCRASSFNTQPPEGGWRRP